MTATSMANTPSVQVMEVFISLQNERKAHPPLGAAAEVSHGVRL
jgi:hypothetical protein